MKRTRRLADALRRLLADELAWSALAVVCAGLLLVEINVLSARTFTRWDHSRGGRFSPSLATQKLIAGLDRPVEVIVLLPRAHPLRVEVRQMLEALSNLSQAISVRYVDPDRDAAAYLALAREQEGAAKNLTDSVSAGSVSSGSAPSGRSTAGSGGLAEAALLVRQAERSWFVPASDLYDQGADGQTRLTIEAAIGEAILRVQTSARLTVCFVTGHGEKSIDDGADDGLLDFGRSLEVKNLEAVRTPLDVPRPDLALRECAVVVVAGPKTPMPAEHERALLAAAERGAHFLLFLDPIVDARGALGDSALHQLSAHFGVRLPRGFVLERAPEQRLPQGIGEAFLAEVIPHPVTSGLSSTEMRLDRRAVIIAAQPLELLGGSVAVPLLTASSSAVILDRLGTEVEDSASAGGRRPLLAAAARVNAASGHEARAVIVGTSNPLDSASFRDPALLGNRVFAERALGWVAARQNALAIPEPEALPAGLALTEESMQDVLYYVLLYMPMTAFLVGLWVLWRRRRAEERSLAGADTAEVG